MDDNFVAMEKKVCPICGVTHTHNTGVLISKYLKPIPEEAQITGYDLCEKDNKLYQEGYVALVVIDPDKSTTTNSGTVKLEDAYRTGELVHAKRTLLQDLLSSPLEDQPFIFIDTELAKTLKTLVENTQ